MCCALAGTDCRPLLLRRRASRPQLKRDPLGRMQRYRVEHLHVLDKSTLASNFVYAFVVPQEGVSTVFFNKGGHTTSIGRFDRRGEFM